MSRQKTANDLRKSCRDRVAYVATKLQGWKTIVCHDKENYDVIDSKRTKTGEAGCKHVWCHDTRNLCHDNNKTAERIYVATSTKYVATQIKNKPREKVATEKQEAMIEEAIKTGGSVAIELSMSLQRDQIGPEFWGSTMQLMR